MSKILIMGGTIFVSKFIARYYIQKGEDVYVFNRDTHKQVDGVTLIKGDKNHIGDAFKKYNFDLIIAVNIYTENEMKELINSLSDIRNFVFISSSAVYPETLPQPFKEEYQVGKNSIWGDYGVNKYMAENYLLKNVPNAYILRPPYLYGEMQNLYREGFVFDCAVKGLPFYMPKKSDMALQFFDVEDLCKFIDIIIDKKPDNHIFNVGNSDVVDIEKFVEECYKVVGTPLTKIYVDESHAQRSYFPFHDYGYSLDVTKQNSLMSNTKSLYDGLKQSFEWYKQNESEIFKKPYFDYIENNLKS